MTNREYMIAQLTDDNFIDDGGASWEHTCVCSECGQIDYSAPNYCPNCGSYNGEEEEKL